MSINRGLVLAFLALFVSTAAAMSFAEEAKPAAAPATAPAPAKAPEAPKAPEPKYDVIGAGLPAISMKYVGKEGAVNLASLGGKAAFFIFMNSSCTACRGEILTLSKTADKFKDAVTPYVVTVDFDPTGTTKRFPDILQTPYTLLDGSDYKVANALGFNFTPATLIVDKAGKQIYRKGGYSAGDDMLIYNALKTAAGK